MDANSTNWHIWQNGYARINRVVPESLVNDLRISNEDCAQIARNSVLGTTTLFVACLLICTIAGAQDLLTSEPEQPTKPNVVRYKFGTTSQGEEVTLYTLTNTERQTVKIMNLGATMTQWWVPDSNGTRRNIILGFPTLDQYEQAGNMYLGAICGRYATHIPGDKFVLDGIDYKLPSSRGGFRGWGKRVWDAEPSMTEQAVTFTYVSPDMEDGFPGTVKISVTYRLHVDGLRIDYAASTDKSTILNVASHPYFNLTGAGKNTILKHELKLFADKFMEVDKDFFPTGKITTVEGSPFDFRNPRPIGETIEAAGGFNHTYVLTDKDVKKDGSLKKVAVVTSQASGLALLCATTEGSVHFATSIEGAKDGFDGRYPEYAGFCLETHPYPDSVYNPNSLNAVLRPGHPYTATTMYRVRLQAN